MTKPERPHKNSPLWDNFKKNPFLIRGFNLSHAIGKVVQVKDDGYEVEFPEQEPRFIEEKYIELGYLEDTKEIVEVSLTTEGYLKLMQEDN